MQIKKWAKAILYIIATIIALWLLDSYIKERGEQAENEFYERCETHMIQSHCDCSRDHECRCNPD